MARPPEPAQPGVKSALRTLDLIEYVVADPAGVVAQEIAAALAIPISSLSYLLATLVERDYLRREGRRYFAGEGLHRLRQDPRKSTIADRARPFVRALGNRLNETTSLFVRVGWELEVVVTEASTQPLRLALEVGTRTPLHTIAAGKAFLAAMPDYQLDRYLAETTLEQFTEQTIVDPVVLRRQVSEIRKTGIARTCDEYNVGISGVGTVVMNGGVAVAGLGVATPTPRFTAELEALTIQQIEQTTRTLERIEAAVQSAPESA